MDAADHLDDANADKAVEGDAVHDGGVDGRIGDDNADDDSAADDVMMLLMLLRMMSMMVLVMLVLTC